MSKAQRIEAARSVVDELQQFGVRDEALPGNVDRNRRWNVRCGGDNRVSQTRSLPIVGTSSVCLE